MKPCATPGRSACLSPATRPPKPCWFDCCAPPVAGARPRNSFSAHSDGSAFNVVGTGVLRKAAQLPLQADARTHADDQIASQPDAERLRAPPALHEVQFCKTSDGVRIAYACVGDGPPLVWRSE